MKHEKIMGMAMIGLLILSTAMLGFMIFYSGNTLLKAQRTNAVAAFNL